MFLQVIWNPNLHQTSLLISPEESNKEFQVILSFILKEDISNSFIQNLIGYHDLGLSYSVDHYLWLSHIHLTKNILAFLHVIDFIDLEEKDLRSFNQFALSHQLSINDYHNLGYQSPVKTIPRDLSSQPSFMSAFLQVGDFSKRLLRTTFDFDANQLIITINKRVIPAQHFFNHLNSDRDRLRIKESLAFPFEEKTPFIDFISSLTIYSEENKKNNENNEQNNISSFHSDHSLSDDKITTYIEKNLIKEDITKLYSIPFLNSALSNNIDNIENKDIKEDLKQKVLEDFSEDNFRDLFADRHIEDFPTVIDAYVDVSDNSVYIEQLEKDTTFQVVNNDFTDELTDDFLVHIEDHLEKQSIPDNIESIEDIEIINETNEESSISVDELVDSINDIFEESVPELELIDIIELPLISFLINVNKNNDDILDNFFINNDVNEELHQFSVEDILSVVNTEVSIFENTISDKKKKTGKNKYEKRSQKNLEKNIKESMNNNASLITIDDEYKEDENNDIENTPIIEIISSESIIQHTLDKNETIPLVIYPILSSVNLKEPLILDCVEHLFIIEFLLSADLVDYSIILESVTSNFFEDSQKRLMDLAMNGDINGIEELYRNYPDFEKPLLNFNYEGDNPLCIASFYENLDIIKKLIDYGWNPNYFDSNLNNALIIASAEGHKHIVRYLLTKNLQINFQNKIGYTALHFAVNDCNHRIVKLLLEAGADVEISDNDRNTPLSIAAFKGDINSTKLLLNTRINVHTKNKKGYDARSIALISKNHAVAKLIEDKIISEKHNHSLPPIIEKNI